jgi:hypothetical protein
MAKRSRGAARPGQLRPTTRRATQAQRPAGRNGAAATDVRPATRPVPEDLDTDLELVEEPVATPARARRAESAAAPARARSGQASGLLAARAAEEYGYVAKDIRHITVVGGGLLVVLLVLWVLIEVAHVIPL